jgi:hypothetical protein
MNRLVTVLGLVAFAAALPAREVLREISWPALTRQGELHLGQVVSPDATRPTESLRVGNDTGRSQTYRLFVLSSPEIARSAYAIEGTVRCAGIEGEGCLEMLSHFPDGTEYFSRTLATSGPMQHLTGTSDWRPFALPFFLQDSPQRPTRLEVNLTLPGRGTVELGPMRLVQYSPGETPGAATGAWWSPSQAGLIGGIAGSVLGLLGGLIGFLAGRGRGRQLVLGILAGMVIFGFAALAVGVAALLAGQPFQVFYPPLLLGILGAALGGTLRGTVRRQYERIELQRMRALDAK